MKAVRVREFGGPDVLAVDEVPVPSPAAGEVLVGLEAAGVIRVHGKAVEIAQPQKLETLVGIAPRESVRA